MSEIAKVFQAMVEEQDIRLPLYIANGTEVYDAANTKVASFAEPHYAFLMVGITNMLPRLTEVLA